MLLHVVQLWTVLGRLAKPMTLDEALNARDPNNREDQGGSAEKVLLHHDDIMLHKWKVMKVIN